MLVARGTGTVSAAVPFASCFEASKKRGCTVNEGAGGSYVYLCAGSGGAQPPITSLRAVSSPTAKASGACPAGYEQVAGNMNAGSSKNGFTYLCASRATNGTGAVVELMGERAATGCANGLVAVRAADCSGAFVFNFDPGGAGVVLCVGNQGGNCPPPPCVAGNPRPLLLWPDTRDAAQAG